MVWVAWPAHGELDIWTSSAAQPRTLTGDDELDAGEIVPGFSLPLRTLW
jgi:hypothetical protein